MNTILKFLAILLLLILCTTVVAEQKSLSPQNQTTKITDNQHFRVSFTSKLEPIVINTMHAWTIYIENNKGQPVLNAEVSVELPIANSSKLARPIANAPSCFNRSIAVAS